jgi:hypothetical protein
MILMLHKPFSVDMMKVILLHCLRNKRRVHKFNEIARRIEISLFQKISITVLSKTVKSIHLREMMRKFIIA